MGGQSSVGRTPEPSAASRRVDASPKQPRGGWTVSPQTYQGHRQAQRRHMPTTDPAWPSDSQAHLGLLTGTWSPQCGILPPRSSAQPCRDEPDRKHTHTHTHTHTLTYTLCAAYTTHICTIHTHTTCIHAIHTHTHTHAMEGEVCLLPGFPDSVIHSRPAVCPPRPTAQPRPRRQTGSTAHT